MNLTELKKGEEAFIIRISTKGELKKRLVDIGITAGEKIRFERNSPFGDPKQYYVRGSYIALRASDAIGIMVRK